LNRPHFNQNTIEFSGRLLTTRAAPTARYRETAIFSITRVPFCLPADAAAAGLRFHRHDRLKEL
jgi:hypothetical protein